jgi:hypothetical protein
MPRVRRRPPQAVRLHRSDLQRVGLLPHRLPRFVERFLDGRGVVERFDELGRRKRWRIVVDIVILVFDGILVVVVLTPRPFTPGRPS